MRIIALAAGAALLAGCGTTTDSPEPAASGEWTTTTFAGESGADSPMVLATEGDDLLVVTVSDKGVLRSGLSSDGGELEAGEPVETGTEYLWLGGAAAHDGGWFTLGTNPVDFEPVGFRSDDGLTWEKVAVDGFTGPADINSIVATDGALVAVGSYRDDEQPDMGGFRATAWRSEDGSTWAEVPLPEATGESYADGVAATDAGLVAVGGSDGSGAVWTSTDAGATWSRSQDPDLDGTYAISGPAAQGGVVVVSTTPGDSGRPGILRSDDGGESWSSAAVPPPSEGSEGYAPVWAGGGRFFTVTSTFLEPWESPEVCYADIELCRQDSAVTLYTSADGDTWQRVDTSGIGSGEDAEVDEVTGTEDGRVVAVQGRYEDGVLLHTWPADAPLPVTDAPGAPPAVEMVEVPRDGELEPGVRYHAPLFVHCGMDWLYLGDRAWLRTDDGPDVETGAGDVGDPDWPIAQQTIFGYATLTDDGVVEYSIGDGEVIATYEPAQRRPPGCD